MVFSINYLPFDALMYVYVSVNCKRWRESCMLVSNAGPEVRKPYCSAPPSVSYARGFPWLSLGLSSLTVDRPIWFCCRCAWLCLLTGGLASGGSSNSPAITVSLFLLFVCLFNGTCSSNYPSLSKRRLITASLEVCYVLSQFNLVAPYPILSFPVWFLSLMFST